MIRGVVVYMYELVPVGEHTFYMDCPSKVGFCTFDGNDVFLIDSGNDKDAAKKALRHVENNGWNLKFVINTHSHADHIGGNAYLHEKTGCELYASGIDVCFSVHPILESSLIYGAYPLPCYKNKFLLAKESPVKDISCLTLPCGVEICHLPGHSFDMIALKTPDDVWFCADAVSSEATLEKYPISYVYNVKEYLESAEKLCRLEGKLFVPSHADAACDISTLVKVNTDKVCCIAELLCELCNDGLAFDEILKAVFDRFGLTLDASQYALSGSTLRSYLSYLEESGRLAHEIRDNRLVWRTLNI